LKWWRKYVQFSAIFLLINLFWSLMNRSADCADALIWEANISKLTNSYHSVLFSRENLITGKHFLHALDVLLLFDTWLNFPGFLCFELNFFLFASKLVLDSWRTLF
jgi:hypothetical protein